MPISAIMDLHHPAPTPGSLEERVYQMVLKEPLDDALLSPICWAAGNTIAMDLSMGELDSDRVRLSNRRLAALLAAQSAPVALHVEPKQSHFDTHTSLAQAAHPWYQRLLASALL
jgi:acetyl esterase/lipase